MRDFKSAMLRLADDAFFELVRNYLGRIKTPFNKHDLIDKLEKFLRRTDIQERIVDLIDDSDARILTAIWILGEPRLDDIHASFGGGSYLDLHQQLLNLEDRLIIYRDEERIAVNPLLTPVLEERVLRPGRLFAFRPVKDSDTVPPEPWLDDSVLVGAYAYIAETGEIFRADGTLRKRIRTELTTRFPMLAESVSSPDGDVPRMRILVDALFAAGACQHDQGIVQIDQRWHELAQTQSSRRVATLIAALACDGRSGYPVLAAAVEHLLGSLDPAIAVEADSVERLLQILAPEQPRESLRRTREALVITGFFARAADGFLIPAAAAAQGAAETTTSEDETAEPETDLVDGRTTPIVVQPNFEVTVPIETRFQDALAIARLARLTRHDRYSHFELTKDRFASALQGGQSLEDIVAELRAVTGDRLPSNVVTSLEGWAAEFESIQLFRGVVLRVEESRRFAVEHSQSLQSLMLRELAPGVYLFRESDVPDVQEALADAGVELVPEVIEPLGGSELAEGSLPAPVSASRQSTFSRIFATATETIGDDKESLDPEAAAWLPEIYEKLDATKMGSDQREAMRGRVESRLIVVREQVADGTMKVEKTEARGLDYVGKVRIIEQAVRAGTALLEIIERSDDGSPIKRLVEPLELEKGGNDLILIAEQLPEREEIRVRVRKLGLVRKLRSGLVKRRPASR
jgi:hypothetical protein